MDNELHQWKAHINQSKQELQDQMQRWHQYRQEYDQLATQLDSIADKTSHQAMIPIGKLAFMPGKLIHTNEIMVHLGDQYYVERSAKQARAMADQRKQLVEEHLRLVEAKYNAVIAKSEAANQLLFPQGDSVNEEGLPIMEIREPIDEPDASSSDNAAIASLPSPEDTPSPTSATSPAVAAAPASEDATNAEDPELQGTDKDEHEQLMAMLDELEREEEAERRELEQALMEEQLAFYEPAPKARPADNDDDDEDEEDDDDVRYDTALADNLFDDDEEYATQGIVDHEDYTVHDKEQEKVDGMDDDEQIKAALQPLPAIAEVDEDPAFERSVPTLKRAVHTTVAEKAAPAPVADEPKSIAPPPIEEKMPARKVSRFKQQMENEKQHKKPAFAVNVKAAQQRRVQIQKQKEVQQEQPETPPIVDTAASKESKNAPIAPSKPKSASDASDAPAVPPKKVSRFKQYQQQQRQATVSSDVGANRAQAVPIAIPGGQTRAPVKKKKEKAVPIDLPRKEGSMTTTEAGDATPAKKKVTWDATASVREHDYNSAPQDSPHDAYEAPLKEMTSPLSPSRTARTPSDILNAILNTPSIALDADGFPSLDNVVADDGDTPIDVNTLIKDLPPSEPLYMPTNDDDFFIRTTMPRAKDAPAPPASLAQPRSKMDTNIMRGAVMERDIESPDLDDVEDEMDLREIKSKYQRQRQNMLAAMGRMTAEPKPLLEVFDEELPLPSRDKIKNKDKEQSTDDQPEPKPKKISRFKATRMQATANDDDMPH
ncbi:hypothetical protein BC940DRAFT_60071 [Gongronella butleri]|nr:hypothetical protein BC940DRAFT_60071 [Gongronella butleri]